MTVREASVIAIQLARDLALSRAECHSYRLLAQQAIHALHNTRQELVRLQAQNRLLLDERAAARTPHLGRAS